MKQSEKKYFILTMRCYCSSHTAESKEVPVARCDFKHCSCISIFMHTFRLGNFFIGAMNWWKMLSIETGLRLAALVLDQLSPNWDLAVVQVLLLIQAGCLGSGRMSRNHCGSGGWTRRTSPADTRLRREDEDDQTN